MLGGWLGRNGAVLMILATLVAVVVSAPASAAPTSAPGPTTAATSFSASQLVVEPGGAPLLVDGRPYRGKLILRAEGSSVKVVNEVGVEDYLLGLREMPPSWPIEAQRAQAIAARSYALNQAIRSRAHGRPHDLCPTAACQVYGGVEAELHGGTVWREAVRSTASQVLLYRGMPILAMYSSSNGGRSLPGAAPYLRSVTDPDDALSPHHSWRVEVPESAVGAAVALPEGAELTAVERSGGQVVAHWREPGPGGADASRPMAVSEFRQRLEEAHPPPPELPRLLPSTTFGLARAQSEDAVAIEGRGWGHGIGMSQYGALGKARRGASAAAILASYYAGLRPVAAPPAVPSSLRVELRSVARSAIAGTGSFRVLGDGGALIAESGGAAPWKVRASRSRLQLTSPPGWAPLPRPAEPVPSGDPFLVAGPPTPRITSVAPVEPTAPPGGTGPAGVVAALLLAGVGIAAWPKLGAAGRIPRPG